MSNSTFIQEMSKVNDSGDIYALAYGYLSGWLDVECKKTSNGQVSRALIEAKLEFIDEAIKLGYDYLNPGRGA